MAVHVDHTQHIFTEHRLGDVERRLFERLVKAIEKLSDDGLEKGLAKASTDSDKLEKETKDLKDKLSKQGVL